MRSTEVTTLTELTIDGRISLGPGFNSKQLFEFYGSDLKSWFHKVRAEHDAILVGAGTIRSDNPLLTTRHFEGKSPVRVILSSDGNLPRQCNVLTDGLPTIVATSRKASANQIEVLQSNPAVTVLVAGGDTVNFGELAEQLRRFDVFKILVEGGSRVLNTVFSSKLLRRVIIKHIPVVCGNTDAPTYFGPNVYSEDCGVSKWTLTELYQVSGVPITVYERSS
ncbi:RibD family protein [Roseibium sp.]|uniref:RibD family protein n=1 Tax=Roseibium sp. TaxID=1936156 RepID=UPI003B522F3A